MIQKYENQSIITIHSINFVHIADKRFKSTKPACNVERDIPVNALILDFPPLPNCAASVAKTILRYFSLRIGSILRNFSSSFSMMQRYYFVFIYTNKMYYLFLDNCLARIKFFEMFICALCKVQTVGFQKLAIAFETSAKPSSSLRRIQHFIAEYVLDIDLIARLIFKMLPHKPPFSVRCTTIFYH